VSKLKVGVVGLRRGASHVHLYQEAIAETEVVAVCDTDQQRAAEVASKYQVARTYTDYAEMLRDRDVDVVIVVTPCADHARHALMALDAGKHTHVELPLVATTLDDCWQVVKAVERTGLKLEMGNMMRWDPRNVSMRRWVSDGTIGDVFYAEGEYMHDVTALMGQPEPDGTASWRNGFGKATQLTIAAGGGLHAIDTLRWILDEEFVDVTGYGNRKVAPYRDVNDTEVALFKTQTGAMARVVVSKTVRRTHSSYFAVFGTNGSVERDRHERNGFDPSPEDRLFLTRAAEAVDGHYPPMTPTPIVHDSDVEKATHGVGHGALTYLQNRDFIDSILDDRMPMLNVYEAARSCAAAISALRAIDEGRPVRIPSIPDRSADFKRFGTRSSDVKNTVKLSV
jgi:predicted dehydrogenase